jgi:hypothetical protein
MGPVLALKGLLLSVGIALVIFSPFAIVVVCLLPEQFFPFLFSKGPSLSVVQPPEKPDDDDEEEA